jgi:hypothetical protein
LCARYGNVTGWAQCPPPAPPTNVQATIGLVGHVIVTWNVSAGAEGYKIYRGSTSSFAQAQNIGLATQGSTTSYTDWGASCHTPYYWVVASNSAGDSQPAGPAMGAPEGCGGGGDETPTPTNTPRPTNTSRPTNTATPTNTLRATSTVTNTPRGTATPTNTPRPTSTDDPARTRTPEPVATNTPRPTSTGTLEARPSSTPTLPARPTAIWTPVS